MTHRGLLSLSPPLLLLHKLHATPRAKHIEKAICGYCWLERHPGGKIVNGLGVLPTVRKTEKAEEDVA